MCATTTSEKEREITLGSSSMGYWRDRPWQVLPATGQPPDNNGRTPFSAMKSGVDDRSMDLNRDETRLRDVQCQIEMLYRDRGKDFNLPARYSALVQLERILLDTARSGSPHRRRFVSSGAVADRLRSSVGCDGRVR